MAIDANSRARFNLSKASVLLLDSTTVGMGVLNQILKGFGANVIYRCTSVRDAQDVVRGQTLQLILADTLSPSGDGYDFVTWLRRTAPEPNRYCPVILLDGHTRTVDVSRSRDCGANFLLKRPLSPLALMERILWIGHEDRQFVENDTYAGPDRRFHDEPVSECRRWNDVPAEAAAEAEPAAPETPE